MNLLVVWKYWLGDYSPVKKKLLRITSYNVCYTKLLRSILQTYAERFSHFSFTHGNAVRLLIDGDETFHAMQEVINNAQHYILIQFYIVNDDAVGRHFQQLLQARVQAGVSYNFV